MKIGNKEYMEVNQRVKEFRTNPKYEGFSLTTEIVDSREGFILMKATVKDSNDRVISNGFAFEVQEADGKNTINLTSYIENCETSAVGRALGFLGIGVDTSIASAEEVSNAVQKQEIIKQSQPKQETSTGRPVEKLTGKSVDEIGKEPFGFNYGNITVDYKLYTRDGKYFWAICDKTQISETVKQYIPTSIE